MTTLPSATSPTWVDISRELMVSLLLDQQAVTYRVTRGLPAGSRVVGAAWHPQLDGTYVVRLYVEAAIGQPALAEGPFTPTLGTLTPFWKPVT